MEKITDTFELIDELNRIATTKYKKKDSNRNHQVFAAALLWIMKYQLTH